MLSYLAFSESRLNTSPLNLAGPKGRGLEYWDWLAFLLRNVPKVRFLVNSYTSLEWEDMRLFDKVYVSQKYVVWNVNRGPTLSFSQNCLSFAWDTCTKEFPRCEHRKYQNISAFTIPLQWSYPPHLLDNETILIETASMMRKLPEFAENHGSYGNLRMKFNEFSMTSQRHFWIITAGIILEKKSNEMHPD